MMTDPKPEPIPSDPIPDKSAPSTDDDSDETAEPLTSDAEDSE